jgi:hypothetical protein
VAGVEIKAGAKVRDTDLKGLRMLRDQLGDRFVAGVILNLGELSYTYEEKLYIAPLDRLWT